MNGQLIKCINEQTDSWGKECMTYKCKTVIKQ